MSDDPARPVAETESAAAVVESPRLERKGQRRRTATPRPTTAEDVDLDESRPAFARAWPNDAALDALVAAFETGDYARVRREAPTLAERTASNAVRRAARELERRLDPDPVAVYMLMVAGALLTLLAGWYWLHPHSP